MSVAAPDWLTALAARKDVADHEWFSSFAPPAGHERRSAVLMLFGPDPRGGEDVVLTERAHTLRSHPGQVSFPGGKVDPGDDGSVGAALREAEEEVGLDPAGVQVLATFPELFLTPSQNAVTPVLAWWPRPVPVGVVDRGDALAHPRRLRTLDEHPRAGVRECRDGLSGIRRLGRYRGWFRLTAEIFREFVDVTDH